MGVDKRKRARYALSYLGIVVIRQRENRGQSRRIGRLQRLVERAIMDVSAQHKIGDAHPLSMP
jgi:hypothetical protein